jgi:large subunit ribosomal protein L17
MRHATRTQSFSRPYNQRVWLLRNLVVSLVEHERISTTLAKAKELRRWAEKAVTLGKRGSLADRRLLMSRIPNKETVAKVFSELAPRFKDRAGGYTRIYKLGRRPGDNAEMALIEFLDAQLKKVDKDTAKKAKKAEKALAAGGKEAKAKERAEKKSAKAQANAEAKSAKAEKKEAKGAAKKKSK